jgi:hypothetical protein
MVSQVSESRPGHPCIAVKGRCGATQDAWGAGALEYDRKTGILRNRDDPNGENEMVPSKVQGVIHEIATRVRPG